MGGPGSGYHLSGKMEKPTQSFLGEGQLLRSGGRTNRPTLAGEGGGGGKSALGSAVVAAARSRCGGHGCRLLSSLCGRSPSALLAWLSIPLCGGCSCPPALLVPSPRLPEEMAGPLGWGTWVLPRRAAAERSA